LTVLTKKTVKEKLKEEYGEDAVHGNKTLIGKLVDDAVQAQ